jgi:hypothetical protein
MCWMTEILPSTKFLSMMEKYFPMWMLKALVILDRDYFKDKTPVYYDDQLIPNAQASSFEFLSDDYSRDSENVFFKTTRLPV